MMTNYQDHVNLLLCHQGNVSLLFTGEDSSVSVDQHLHLLDHDVNLFVCYPGNAHIGLLFTVKYILLPTMKQIRGAQVHYRDYLTALSEKERFNHFHNSTV